MPFLARRLLLPLGLTLTPAMCLCGLAICAPAASPGVQEPGEAALPSAARPESFPQLALRKIADGFEQPLYAKAAPGQPGRLYVLEKTGRIRIVELADGRIHETPFLDFREKVSTRSERGLLGLAFDADYAENRIFYVHYSATDGDTVLARMLADPEQPLQALPASEEILFREEQPFANHDGGELSFGPDGMLYLGLGDGGAAADPKNNGQKPDSLLGKILRLDVSGGPGSGYSIPADNPFVDDETFRPEVWAWGLRNPWRFSFDRETGDLWIGDVGQNKWEEVNFAPASSRGGENYGWRIREAAHPFNEDDPKPTVPLIDPIFEYRQGGPLQARSVTGGYVYRGSALPGLRGWYVFGDYASGQVWALRQQGGAIEASVDLTPMLAKEPGQAAVRALASFGEDTAGELYLLSLSEGTLLQLVAGAAPPSDEEG